MYAFPSFETKKALKKAVAKGEAVSIPGPGPFLVNGVVTVKGPNYSEPHTWHTQVTVINGNATKVK